MAADRCDAAEDWSGDPREVARRGLSYAAALVALPSAQTTDTPAPVPVPTSGWARGESAQLDLGLERLLRGDSSPPQARASAGECAPLVSASPRSFSERVVSISSDSSVA